MFPNKPFNIQIIPLINLQHTPSQTILRVPTATQSHSLKQNTFNDGVDLPMPLKPLTIACPSFPGNHLLRIRAQVHCQYAQEHQVAEMAGAGGSMGVRSERLPVLPCLEAGAVEEEVEGLPVVEDLVAVVDQVGGRAHVAEEPERQEREEPLDTLVLAVPVSAGPPPPVLGVLGVPIICRWRRCSGPALARRRERHGWSSR
jgi:hypothetical protein